MGGAVDAVVLNPLMVHLDEQENVLKSWSGVDHIPVDAQIGLVSCFTVDHLHWNSVQLDQHGGVLLSFRNRSQIVRLSPEDWSPFIGSWEEWKAILCWRMGWDGFHVNTMSTTLAMDASCCLTMEMAVLKHVLGRLSSPGHSPFTAQNSMAIRPPTSGMRPPKGAPFDWTTATHSLRGELLERRSLAQG